MKTERELFLYELEGRGFIFKNKTWIHGMGDVGGLFDDDQLNMVWGMWQASASRDGYKLVPCEKLEGLKIDADRMISSAHLYQDEYHIKSFGRSFLNNCKDMTGVVE